MKHLRVLGEAGLVVKHSRMAYWIIQAIGCWIFLVVAALQMSNIIRDPRAALLFLIPGSGTTLRVNGRAQLTTDASLLQSFAVENQLPETKH
jgi:Pyridoxamine 5'-phosphate oxidase